MAKTDDPISKVRQFYKPRPVDAAVQTRKSRFDALNRFVRDGGGWITSIPGAAEVVVECLPDGTLPDELRKLGYEPEPAGAGQRILPGEIVERFTTGPDGGLVALTSGSTKPVVEVRRHAGICQVDRYTFRL